MSNAGSRARVSASSRFRQAWAVIAMLAIVGVAALVNVGAATPRAGLEAEAAKVSGNATVSGDPLASGGSYLRFAGAPEDALPAVSNPGASESTRKLQKYLLSFEGRTEGRVLSGQHTGNDSSFASEMADITLIKEASGEDVALWGFDVQSGIGRARAGLKAHWDAGGLVAMTSHHGNPVNGLPLFPATTESQTLDINKMLTPGTNEWNKWHAQMDSIASSLQAMEDDGVTVLWRPYHEMNNSSWWWTYRNPTQSTANYKKMWIRMHDYFSGTKGLSNILWVWGPHISDMAGTGLEAWYPGDAYVDVIGPDSYKGAGHTSTEIRRFNEAAANHPDKPAALTEAGYLSGGVKTSWNLTDGSDSLLDLMQNNIPSYTYYMFWNNGHEHHTHANYVSFLRNPLVANRDDAALRDR